MKFRPLTFFDASAVATLHIEGITAGFISSLGKEFVEYLYEGIVASSQAFGFVAIEDDRVIGFITCVKSVTSIYKYILRNHFFKLVLAILPKLLRLSNVKDVIETLFYPRGAGKDLNCAEIVAIVVDGRWRGKGVGRSLILKAVDETGRRGMEKIKVMVGEPLSAQRVGTCRPFRTSRQFGSVPPAL